MGWFFWCVCREGGNKQANPKYKTTDKPGLNTSMRRELHSWWSDTYRGRGNGQARTAWGSSCRNSSGPCIQRMASLPPYTMESVSHWGFPITMESCAAILEMSFSFRYGIILRISHSSGRTILAKVNASLVKPIQMFQNEARWKNHSGHPCILFFSRNMNFFVEVCERLSDRSTKKTTYRFWSFSIDTW